MRTRAKCSQVKYHFCFFGSHLVPVATNDKPEGPVQIPASEIELLFHESFFKMIDFGMRVRSVKRTDRFLVLQLKRLKSSYEQTDATLLHGHIVVGLCCVRLPPCCLLFDVVGQSLKPVKLLFPCKRTQQCGPTPPNIV